MEMRTILAAVSGGSASSGVADLACRLARRFGSHLEGFHARVDPRDIAMAAADGLGAPFTGDLIEATSREVAARARRIFEAAMARHGLVRREAPPPPGSDPTLLREASACWREEEGSSPVMLSQRGRLFDLIVLGRSGRVVDEASSDAIEEALLTAGRPLLVAPVKPPKALGESIAVAWNDSPECAKALAAAMPFLAQAREVHVLAADEGGAAAVTIHLAWHGIRGQGHAVHAVEGVGPGESVLAAARDHEADLLVLGGYGRAPWRETLFGGATRQVLGSSLLPLLLSH